MDPPGPNDGSNNEDRKPAAINTPPRRRSQEQSSEGQEEQEQEQEQQPTERQNESQLQLLQRSVPQLPYVALNESSSASELMRRLVEAGVMASPPATAHSTNASATTANSGSNASSMDHGRLEELLRQRLGLAPQPPDVATTANRLIGGSSTELQFACLQAQVLLRQQEDSLRNTRMLLQQYQDSLPSAAPADAERRPSEHQMLSAALAGQATSATANSNATAAAGNHLATEMLLRQLLGGNAAQAAATTPQAAEAHNIRQAQAAHRAQVQERAQARAQAETHAQASSVAQRPETVARSASQGSAEEGDGDDDDDNANAASSQPDAASFCADEDDLNDDDYFKDFDTEDSHKLNNETFPFRLYRMLYEVEQAGSQDVASFASKGQVFLVHRPKRFVEEIMPKYFSTTRLASFQRQLNLYGFQRINEGGLRGGYYHKYFQKGKRALCRKIKRQRTRAKAGGTGGSNTASTATSYASANAMRASQSIPTMSAPAPPAVASMPASYTTNLPSNVAAAAASAAIQTSNQINQTLAAELARQVAAAAQFNRMVDQNRRSDNSIQGFLDPSLHGGRPAPPVFGFLAPAPATPRLSLPPSSTLRNSFTANNNDTTTTTNTNNNTSNNTPAFNLYQALARLHQAPGPGPAPSNTEQKDGRP